jgi:hypothetical protein
LELLEPPVRLRIPLAGRCGQKDPRLVTVFWDSPAMPVQIRQRDFGGRVPLLDGDPKQLDGIGCTDAGICSEQLFCLQIF